MNLVSDFYTQGQCGIKLGTIVPFTKLGHLQIKVCYNIVIRSVFYIIYSTVTLVFKKETEWQFGSFTGQTKTQVKYDQLSDGNHSHTYSHSNPSLWPKLNKDRPMNKMLMLLCIMNGAVISLTNYWLGTFLLQPWPLALWPKMHWTN